MEEANARQYIQIGKYRVELPPGVTVADWALERVKVQNPRIRSYLGCIRMLEEVLDSNYAILHCSPERLLKIWRQVQQVCQLIRSELSPTLKEPSVFPSLDAARRNAEASFKTLAKTVIAAIERYPHRIPSDQLPEVRKLLCVSIGKMYAFLRDSFGEIVANDPRSRHDADYFLSKRFAQDIEESEWLYSSVYELRDYLDGLEKVWLVEFKDLLARMRKERMIPHQSAWDQTKKLLNMLLDGLTPKLKEVLTLRGIRFDEMESLDGYAFDIPHHCKALTDVYAVGREVIEQIKATAGTSLKEREQSVKDLISCHEVVSGRMVDLISRIGSKLGDLTAYVPIWMAGIERRRSLMLSKNPAEIPSRAARFVSESGSSDREHKG